MIPYMGEMIELTSADRFQFAAYAASARGRRRGGLVILSDSFGMTDHVREVVDRYAGLGYDVIAPALLDRMERNLSLPYNAAGIARGTGLSSRLDWDKPLKDVTAAMRHVAQHEPVGILGFAWGASVAYLAAAKLSGVACAVCYYGPEIIKLLEDVPAIPVMMHFGQRDQTITKGNIDLIRHRNTNATIYTYPAAHGFYCEARTSYDKPSADLAEERTNQFLEQYVMRAGQGAGAGANAGATPGPAQDKKPRTGRNTRAR